MKHLQRINDLFSRLFRNLPPTEADKRETLRLVGERVFLRPLAPEDAEAMHAFATDPEVTRYLPWESNTTLAGVRTWLAEQVERRHHGHSLGLAIIHRESGQMIGSTDLMDLRVRQGQAELGYLLATAFWNQGMMTEATRLTLRYGFEEMHLTKVYAWVDNANIASRRVLEKLRMHHAESEVRFVKGERRSYLRYEVESATFRAHS